MNNEPITKQQAIDLANRLQAFIGIAGASLYSKEVERLPSCWISVKDRMPRESDPVLVWGNGFIEVGWYGETLGRWMSENFDYDEGEVTHWMPLPEPPKE